MGSLDASIGAGSDTGIGWVRVPSLNEFERAFLLNFFGRERSHVDVLDSTSETTTAAGYGDFLRSRFEPLFGPVSGPTTGVIGSPVVLATDSLLFFPNKLRSRVLPLDLRSQVDSVPEAAADASRSCSPGKRAGAVCEVVARGGAETNSPNSLVFGREVGCSGDDFGRALELLGSEASRGNGMFS